MINNLSVSSGFNDNVSYRRDIKFVIQKSSVLFLQHLVFSILSHFRFLFQNLNNFL